MMFDINKPFRDPVVINAEIEKIQSYSGRPLAIMEVCGTHTMAVMRYGIRDLLPANVRLISGPGCPVCVTGTSYIDAACYIAKMPNTIIATFGDLIRVPGSSTSLTQMRMQGADIRTVYSPLDCIKLCTDNPDKIVVFLAVGFETTIPVTALTILKMYEMLINNFVMLTAHKTMPAALNALANDKEIKIDGLILPGHVSAIIGTNFYSEFCARTGIPGAVTGFEPADILASILSIMRHCNGEIAGVDNLYSRVVKKDGNIHALAVIDEVYEPCDAVWRGIGNIPGSGLKLRKKYDHHDAEIRLNLPTFTDDENTPCRCGEVLRGKITPADCPLYAESCTPENPIGACMVSSEGACAAYYRYKRESK
ncbi:MAG: hydrogenase formation protein HypD [bacterium]